MHFEWPGRRSITSPEVIAGVEPDRAHAFYTIWFSMGFSIGTSIFIASVTVVVRGKVASGSARVLPHLATHSAFVSDSLDALPNED